MRRLPKPFVFPICPDDDPAGVQIVIERFRLAQKFRAEQEVLCSEFFPGTRCKSHRDRRLDHHYRVRITGGHLLYHLFHRAGIKEIFLAVVVGGSGYDDKIRTLVRRLPVQRVLFFPERRPPPLRCDAAPEARRWTGRHSRCLRLLCSLIDFPFLVPDTALCCSTVDIEEKCSDLPLHFSLQIPARQPHLCKSYRFFHTSIHMPHRMPDK